LPRIELVTTFLVNPDPAWDTRPQSINSNGDIAGYTEREDHGTQGFVRFRNGTYSIIENPNGKPLSTTVIGINDSGLIAGNYSGRSASAFFLSGDTYTDFNVPGAIFTYIASLNNAGDFTGRAFYHPGDFYQPYISVGGNVTSFFIVQPEVTGVGGMNNLNQVVGHYVDPPGVVHGYLRDADGTLTFPIDYPGAIWTDLLGINDKGWMVGYYLDTEGVYHGLFLNSPTRFVVFDLGSSITILTGINNQGKICGYYGHFGDLTGFVARVVLPSSK
jgi:hypothetical protein